MQDSMQELTTTGSDSVSENSSGSSPQDPGEADGGGDNVSPDTETGGGSPPTQTDGAETGAGDGPGVAETDGGSPSDVVSDELDTGVDSATAQMQESLVQMQESFAELQYDQILAPLADSIQTLADMISLQSELYISTHAVPISGYLDWDYPISVTWEVYPSAPGAPSSMENVSSHDTPEDFEAEYDRLSTLVGQTLTGFRVLRVSDCSDEEFVYDADAVVEEPEDPAPGASDAYQADVLAALASIHEDLQTISGNDLVAYESMQEALADMQEANTVMQYNVIASNIAVICALAVLSGFIIIGRFFHRMN